MAADKRWCDCWIVAERMGNKVEIRGRLCNCKEVPLSRIIDLVVDTKHLAEGGRLRIGIVRGCNEMCGLVVGFAQGRICETYAAYYLARLSVQGQERSC